MPPKLLETREPLGRVTLVGAAGKMGTQMVGSLLHAGFEVAAVDKNVDARGALPHTLQTMGVPGELVEARLRVLGDLTDSRTTAPQVVVSMVASTPRGIKSPTEGVLEQVRVKLARPEDVVVEGGNSYPPDTDRRGQEYRNAGLQLLSAGVSGGTHIYDNGACIMVSGPRAAYDQAVPVFDALTQPNGAYDHFGSDTDTGLADMLKSIHNGIEYQDLMARAMAGQMIQEYVGNTGETARVFDLYQRGGSVVAGNETDLTRAALERHGEGLDGISGVVGASGTGQWTLEAALASGLPEEMIAGLRAAIDFRTATRQDPDLAGTFAAKLLNATRSEMGGHNDGKGELTTDGTTQ